MTGIRVTKSIAGRLASESRVNAGAECCGLLAGRNGVITQAFPARNVAKDPKSNYEIAPVEIVRLMREFRAQGLEFLGIYHSHPNGDNVPSPRDIELAYYSEAIYFIVTPRPYATAPVRAFSIRDGQVAELEIETVA